MGWRISEGIGRAKGAATLGFAVAVLTGCDSGAPADPAPAGAPDRPARSAGSAAPAPTVAGRSATEFWRLDAGSRTVVAMAGGRRRALFLCDALDRPAALAITVPDSDGAADLVTLPDGAPPTRRPVTVGPGDPGAGNIHFPLSSGGRTIGDLHALNVGILAGNTVPTVRSVTLEGANSECRWAPHTRLLAVTPRRTVLVTGGGDQGPLRYRTFDDGAKLASLSTSTPERGTEASLDLTGGRERGGAYAFRNGDYEYRLDPAAATLTVARDGAVVQTEPLLAWTVGGG